jgi:hypothetical protein
LIAAYKTLGGSFTGNLTVDPSHLRDLRRLGLSPGADRPPADNEWQSSDRSRRIRDSVEGALSDVILLGTEDQVRLAAKAAQELAAGRAVHTAELVVSLRNFIRQVLDLEAVPTDLVIPKQGPARATASKGGKDEGSRDGKQGGKNQDADAAGGGTGMGGGYGSEDSSESHHEV